MTQATSATASRNFIDELCKEARNHRAINHPYLQQLIAGSVPDIKRAMNDFVLQYSLYSADFLRYLAGTIAQLEKPEHRKALLKNVVEESGHIDDDDAAALKSVGIEIEWVDKVPHPELFARYLNAVGLDAEYRRHAVFADDALIWRDLFFSLCAKEGPARALGAIGLGTENIVKYVYRQFIQAIERHLAVSLRDRVFFDLHAMLDDQHGAVLTDIAADYAKEPDNRKAIREGMLMALSIRNAFFDALQARAHAMAPAH